MEKDELTQKVEENKLILIGLITIGRAWAKKIELLYDSVKLNYPGFEDRFNDSVYDDMEVADKLEEQLGYAKELKEFDLEELLKKCP